MQESDWGLLSRQGHSNSQRFFAHLKPETKAASQPQASKRGLATPLNLSGARAPCVPSPALMDRSSPRVGVRVCVRVCVCARVHVRASVRAGGRAGGGACGVVCVVCVGCGVCGVCVVCVWCVWCVWGVCV